MINRLDQLSCLNKKRKPSRCYRILDYIRLVLLATHLELTDWEVEDKETEKEFYGHYYRNMTNNFSKDQVFSRQIHFHHSKTQFLRLSLKGVSGYWCLRPKDVECVLVKLSLHTFHTGPTLTFASSQNWYTSPWVFSSEKTYCLV